MPTPTRRGACEGDGDDGSMGDLNGGVEARWRGGGSRETPPARSGTRKLVIRGRRLRMEPALSRTRRDQSAARGRTSPDRKISSRLPRKGTPAFQAGVELNIQPDRAGMTGLQGSGLSSRPGR